MVTGMIGNKYIKVSRGRGGEWVAEVSTCRGVGRRAKGRMWLRV